MCCQVEDDRRLALSRCKSLTQASLPHTKGPPAKVKEMKLVKCTINFPNFFYLQHLAGKVFVIIFQMRLFFGISRRPELIVIFAPKEFSSFGFHIRLWPCFHSMGRSPWNFARISKNELHRPFNTNCSEAQVRGVQIWIPQVLTLPNPSEVLFKFKNMSEK